MTFSLENVYIFINSPLKRSSSNDNQIAMGTSTVRLYSLNTIHHQKNPNKPKRKKPPPNPSLLEKVTDTRSVAESTEY